MLVEKTKRHGVKSNLRTCRWCDKSLPSNYHLVICPKCRKDSIDDYTKSGEEPKRVVEVTVARRE
ncbi:MAG: hypothetical protein NWF08_07435 [Candidatus Bathyarchaeota archaeon]|nr:hypothetical protein [Candidatus Bathyarchaeota archaeon]